MSLKKPRDASILKSVSLRLENPMLGTISVNRASIKSHLLITIWPWVVLVLIQQALYLIVFKTEKSGNLDSRIHFVLSLFFEITFS